MSTRFFQQINYSSCTEDSEAEIAALRLKSTDRVVCITGSGARTLDLLTQMPAKIHSVDLSIPQNCLLQLKMAGYRYLQYEEFLALLGIPDSSKCDFYLKVLLPYLPIDARDYWVAHQSSLKRGLLYCGTWEKLLRAMSKTTWIRKRHVDGLLNSPDLESQSVYWQKHWSGFFFRTYLKCLSNRFLWTKIIQEPGAKLIPNDFDVAGYMYRCLEKMANHSLIRENPYGNLLFYGRYTEHCELPLHLQEKNFELIRSQLDCIEVHDQRLVDFLMESPRRFDAYSLSDFSSYAPARQYMETWESVISSAQANARYCERFFLVKHNPLLGPLQRDRPLETELSKIDHTCLYTFHAGVIP